MIKNFLTKSVRNSVFIVPTTKKFAKINSQSFGVIRNKNIKLWKIIIKYNENLIYLVVMIKITLTYPTDDARKFLNDPHSDYKH